MTPSRCRDNHSAYSFGGPLTALLALALFSLCGFSTTCNASAAQGATAAVGSGSAEESNCSCAANFCRDDDCDDLPCAAACEPAWSVMADGLWLHRSHAQGYGVLFDRATGAELFNASQLGADTQAGPRIILLRPLPCGRLLDLEYFGIDEWSSAANFGPQAMQLTGDRSQAGPAVQTASLSYASRLHTAEVNVRGADYCGIRPLAGFRWVQLNETYQADGLTDDAGLPLLPYLLRYQTRNDLYGFQLGAAAVLWDRGGPLSVSSVGKAGIYLDDSSSVAGYTQPGFSVQLPGSRTRHAAFFGEVGVTATWQWTDHLALRGGYQVYWLEGVALAPNQVLATDIVGGTGGIDATGGVFLHGADVGVQATW